MKHFPRSFAQTKEKETLPRFCWIDRKPAELLIFLDDNVCSATYLLCSTKTPTEKLTWVNVIQEQQLKRNRYSCNRQLYRQREFSGNETRDGGNIMLSPEHNRT